MTASSLTLPMTFMRRASSGYVGAVFDFTWRLVSSVEPVCENVEAPPRSATAVAVIANFVHQLILIDTTPPGIGRCPEVEKARRVPREGAPTRARCCASGRSQAIDPKRFNRRLQIAGRRLLEGRSSQRP